MPGPGRPSLRLLPAPGHRTGPHRTPGRSGRRGRRDPADPRRTRARHREINRKRVARPMRIDHIAGHMHARLVTDARLRRPGRRSRLSHGTGAPGTSAGPSPGSAAGTAYTAAWGVSARATAMPWPSRSSRVRNASCPMGDVSPRRPRHGWSCSAGWPTTTGVGVTPPSATSCRPSSNNDRPRHLRCHSLHETRCPLPRLSLTPRKEHRFAITVKVHAPNRYAVASTQRGRASRRRPLPRPRLAADSRQSIVPAR